MCLCLILKSHIAVGIKSEMGLREKLNRALEYMLADWINMASI